MSMLDDQYDEMRAVVIIVRCCKVGCKNYQSMQ